MTLTPPPNSGQFDSRSWQGWFDQLYKNVTSGNAVTWTSIDKSGSSLSDLVSRQHNVLQSIQGGGAGDYQHLTTAQVSAFTGGSQGTITNISATNVDITLTTAQSYAIILQVSGTLTANVNIIVPTTTAQYTVYNGTTGAFTLTFKTSAGTGITVATGKRAIVYCDGTNVVRVTADT